MATERSISWRALKKGTSVTTSSGHDVGEVTDVVGDDQKDIFSGITFKDGALGDTHYAPADSIERITGFEVRLTLTSDEVGSLPPEP